ncbi:MAG: flagellar basal body rod protein FlgB [Alphaproteobacteria bacterium]|nr:flagellar basal body rod protein FlgB [Alphaproteobacteria bacterium]
MALNDISIFSALKQKMRWQQARQTVLAENVANAETNGYKARDLRPFEFGDQLKNIEMARVSSTTADKRHFSLQTQNPQGFGAKSSTSFEVTPDGNGVVLEEQMIKISSNQLDYQAATTLYSRSVRVLRTALGRA